MDDSKFITEIIEYNADDSWVEQTIIDIYLKLNEEATPKPSIDCKHCNYISQIKEGSILEAVNRVTPSAIQKNKGKNKELEKLHIAEERLEEVKNLYVYPELSSKVLQVVRELSEQKKLKGKTLEKGFDAKGLIIKPKNGKPRDLDRWYGYIIIESEYFRELTWMMNIMLRIFKDYFQGMEAREYLYDHIANRMQESLKSNGINEVFRDVIEEAEKLIQKVKVNYLN